MQLENSKVGIIIIAYNNSDVILKQFQCINKFCKDQFEIVIIDNSSDSEASKKIKYHSDKTGTTYIRTKASSINGSSSHAFAANLSYVKFKDSFDYLFYLDHDCFPVKDFSVIGILENKLFAGLGQGKYKKYFWPGCVMWNNSAIDKSLIDFSPNSEFHLDTGGNFYKAIDSYPEALVFFNENHVQNPHFNKSFYNFYAMINDEMFMHFLNSSNWNGSAHNSERINSLINILNEKAGF